MCMRARVAGKESGSGERSMWSMHLKIGLSTSYPTLAPSRDMSEN